MSVFRKKADPVSDRERELTDEIARLEAQARNLEARMQQDRSLPRLRSTALPHGPTIVNRAPQPAPSPAPAPPPPAANEPIFEEVSADLEQAQAEAATTGEHYNDLGVRKYDLPELLRRIRAHFRGPSTTNPKLVSYLAAGGIQGLRPLRIEKRVARNRFIALALVLFLILVGLIAAFVKHRY
ncbi:MAG TPA: hypothetical protein VMU04_07280 [Candidatus Acidoferrum sp.]|nr:hypothetical protein [Candidatus Acidoferrum sp.]